MDIPARPLGEPVADRLGLMARHIINDDVDIELVGHIGLDGIQKGAALARPVPGETAADHLASRGIESGEQ